MHFEREMKSMSLVGFDLALEHAIRTPLIGGRGEVDVASLAALVVMKMVSWLDRPYERFRDLGDLAHVLNEALSDTDDRRWQWPLADLDFEDQSAFFAGCEVGAIARKVHLDAIGVFLAAIADEGRTWAAVMAREGGYIAEDSERAVRRRIAAFERGLRSTC